MGQSCLRPGGAQKSTIGERLRDERPARSNATENTNIEVEVDTILRNVKNGSKLKAGAEQKPAPKSKKSGDSKALVVSLHNEQEIQGKELTMDKNSFAFNKNKIGMINRAPGEKMEAGSFQVMDDQEALFDDALNAALNDLDEEDFDLPFYSQLDRAYKVGKEVEYPPEMVNPVTFSLKDGQKEYAEITFGFKTQQGRTSLRKNSGTEKANQDALTIMRSKDRQERALFAVFDGHGPFGEHASYFCRKELSKMLLIAERQHPDDSPEDQLVHALRYLNRKFAKTDWKKQIVDPIVSGTCAIVVLFDREKVVCANIGDSRAIVAQQKQNGEIVVAPLSDDHKPEREDERDRILQTKAVLMQENIPVEKPTMEEARARNNSTMGLGNFRRGQNGVNTDADATRKDSFEQYSDLFVDEDEVQPPKSVKSPKEFEKEAADADWARLKVQKPKTYICRQQKNQVIYGVLFTRSIGDVDAHRHLGVSAEPEMTFQHVLADVTTPLTAEWDPRQGDGLEISTENINKLNKVIILASDGIWDVMSNEQCAAIAFRHMDPVKASEEIVEIASKMWARSGEGRRDDITVIIVGLGPGFKQ